MEKIDNKAILSRIKWLIENDYRPKKDLAAYLGKTRQIFYDWEKSFNPNLSDLLNIAKYFGVPLEYLISGNESPIDDSTAAFLVTTQGLTEEQKKIIYASIMAQVELFKKMNENKEIDK